MNRLAISAGILFSLSSINVAQAASNGTVSFSGKLSATTCDINIDNQGADATVTLPTLSIGQLNGAGVTAGKTAFNMEFSNCPLMTAGRRVAAFFEAGPTVDLATGRLKNASGTAENVDLVLSGNGYTIKAGKLPGQNYSFRGNPATVIIPYYVSYYATAPTTAGTVRSSVVYSIVYM